LTIASKVAQVDATELAVVVIIASNIAVKVTKAAYAITIIFMAFGIDVLITFVA
jgi:hypothetical protein